MWVYSLEADRDGKKAIFSSYSVSLYVDTEDGCGSVKLLVMLPQHQSCQLLSLGPRLKTATVSWICTPVFSYSKLFSILIIFEII